MEKEVTIGLFDSGVGGLGVAKAIEYELRALKPHMLYVGDTAHTPWGDKSRVHIIEYATKITEYLLDSGSDIIVIACNTATAVAKEALLERFAGVKIYNIMDPLFAFLQAKPSQKLGIIGTRQTIKSAAYNKLLANLDRRLVSLSTPLLVPLIEEGLMEHPATYSILERYLDKLELDDGDCIILGCTHYHLIKHLFEMYYESHGINITIVDGASILAEKLAKDLVHAIPKIYKKRSSRKEFYITDDSEFFVDTARKFFPAAQLGFLPLWDK